MEDATVSENVDTEPNFEVCRDNGSDKLFSKYDRLMHEFESFKTVSSSSTSLLQGSSADHRNQDSPVSPLISISKTPRAANKSLCQHLSCTVETQAFSSPSTSTSYLHARTSIKRLAQPFRKHFAKQENKIFVLRQMHCRIWDWGQQAAHMPMV
ncbi:hypothetical protein TNCV_1757761 [Trichonephila clavipes]|nr:hypothetical protein TNCV_1757761 [Trichonephila clavipes]